MRNRIGLLFLWLSGCGTPSPMMDAAMPSEASVDVASTDGAVPESGTVESGVSEAGSATMCTFNADCMANQRCECSETEGCFCRVGVRGRGRVGVDRCMTGNDCETALCVEGNGGFYCSGPCTTEAQCAGALPLCSSIALVGMICIRRPM